MAKEIAEEYASSLADLTVNSKPLINMLTILAEENIDHAGVIVETVEKHLEKVPAEIKLPVLYLVDSIIKNVGGAYTQKFAQSIVSMFTRTFKQVDEKIRSQMFKLRETWHDVFPSTKLYQLDVKVNLIDPAWPIQAQPQQANIHVNPNFLKKQQQPTPPANNVTQLTDEEEKMRVMLAKKEQELLMLQRKKIEMELEQTKRQLELAEKSVKKPPIPGAALTSMPVAMVNPVVTPVVPVIPPEAPVMQIPVKQRLGPPVNKPSSRIAPVSAALASARRDPRLLRHPPSAAVAPSVAKSPPVIAPNVFDIKPLDRPTKRHNVLTIDVQPDPPTAPPRRRDPRLERTKRNRDLARKDLEKSKAEPKKPTPPPPELHTNYIGKLPDPKKISKLPPIPKINREERTEASPSKKRKETRSDKKKKLDDSGSGKESSSSSSPDKKQQKTKKDKSVEKEKKDKPKERRVNIEEKPTEPEPVVFKELKNYHKERYMRRNREKSESPDKVVEKESEAPFAIADTSNTPAPEVVSENKDVDLRVLPAVVETKAAAIAQKRSSTEALEVKSKKSKHDKFDILFGSEDVDLRQLPQVEELNAPPPPILTESPKSSKSKSPKKTEEKIPVKDPTPPASPKKKDWNEVKENSEGLKKPSKLDIVRAKLAEATKGKDRLGRPLLFTKSPSVEKERRRTISSNGNEDIDMRHEEFDAEDHKKTISIIMNQAKEQYNDGQLDQNQYNTLMFQVLQLNEKLKLKEAKQRESFEISKRKLNAQINEEKKVVTPKSSPKLSGPNNFGDIDERVNPAPFMDTPPDSQGFLKDSDMRVNGPPVENMEIVNNGPLPMPPMMPMFMGPINPTWRGPRGRPDDFGPRRFRGPVPPFMRGKFDKRGGGLVPAFDPILPLPLPAPQLGICQGPCPLVHYERSASPPLLGTAGTNIPPTDLRILEYIDQDPVKTIQIDGIPREIRFYGETAIIMLDWDDPREIKFLPGCRRVTFDNKDSVVVSFNEGYKQVEIDDQVFEIRFGAPTRELYINGRWHECFFGGPPFGVIIDGKPRLVQLEGPLPQVDIGKDKRTDLVAGKINLIVNATQMCPVYLDAKVQKFAINDKFFTIRFVDSLRTVLINEQPFAVKYGDLPEPIYVGNEKYFIRFSALPRNVKPGHVQIANMEGSGIPPKPVIPFENIHLHAMDVDQDLSRPLKTPSPDGESGGLDMLASLMPSNISSTPSASEYSLAEPLFTKTDKIPGLDSSTEESTPANPLSGILGNVNVTDLFAKLVATGIVPLPPKTEVRDEVNPESKTIQDPVEKQTEKKEDKSVIHPVDLLKPETLRVKQPGIVAKLYGGMQCSGCGTRFPPEQTVRYSAHLDWHFRQNRRERDSARRAHSRHWHYDLPDWLQYEETELDAREKNWFETGAAEEAEAAEVPVETPSVAALTPQDHCCALCGDKFDQFYNEDKEEWHLRNSVRFEDKNYHPPCLEDYKASQIKEVEEQQQMESEVITLDKTETEDAIEINEEDKEDSDNESVVEVLDPPEENLPEPVEIDEGDEDDVVLKAEPIEEVVVDDDNDTDDETTQVRRERDKAIEVDLSRVKKEPVEPDDEPIIAADVEQPVVPTIEPSHPTLLSSIDGNVHMESSVPPSLSLPIGGIRINISKAIPTVVSTENSESDKMYDDISADDEPLPPGEEPELEFKVKPTLEGVHFRRQPPVQKGNELSGLCSIM